MRRSIKEQELLAEFLPGEDALDETAAAALGEAELDTLLARLAPEERTLLVLRYEEGYTAAELEPDTIAKKLTLCDCVEVSCTRLQQNAVNAVARDVVHIALTDAPMRRTRRTPGRCGSTRRNTSCNLQAILPVNRNAGKRRKALPPKQREGPSGILDAFFQALTMLSPFPARKVRRFPVVMSISRCRASAVVQAMWGVSSTWGASRRGLSGGSGSVQKASAP